MTYVPSGVTYDDFKRNHRRIRKALHMTAKRYFGRQIDDYLKYSLKSDYSRVLLHAEKLKWIVVFPEEAQ